MILKVFIDDQTYDITVPDELVRDAEEFFARMDADMNRGYQMSQTWVEQPNVEQRCKIAADKLLTALHTGNENMARMMGAYVLSRLPQVRGIRINPEGDMSEHELLGEPDLHLV